MENRWNRRNFFTKTSLGLGALSFYHLLHGKGLDNLMSFSAPILAKVKRIVYLFQSGGPSQLDLFDYKPVLAQYHGQELPDSVRRGQRLTGMSANQTSLPVTASKYTFNKYGECGRWISQLMPYTAGVVDDLCFVHTIHTEAINHDPAITFFQTGSMLPGRPSIGSWVSYGLGSDNENLPAFIVLVSKDGVGQPLYARLWGNGFLPTEHQGVQFRAGKDPVLFLKDPDGYQREDRARMLQYLGDLNRQQYDTYGDPEINSRMAQYEMAFRMQASVPDVMNVSTEPEYIYDLYGPDSREPGTYAYNCILARKLLEQNVKFVQLYHQDWDHHLNLPSGLEVQCRKTDQPTAALVKDLKQRGLLDDTLVIWGGEFGRTVYSQGKLTADNYGRDHHPRCFTIWMAGAGIKSGFSYGNTDDFGYNIVQDPVHVHDFQATLLHLLGINHEELTFKFQGRRYRLTDVHGNVVQSLLA